MPAKKRQHYVPRFYLRNFSNQTNGKSIGIFNIKQGKVILAGSLKEQAYGEYFYGKDGTIEEGLGKIEESASRIISSIINHREYPKRPSEDYGTLLIFTIFLHGRMKHAADEENEVLDKFVRIMFSKDRRFKDHLNHLSIGFKDAPQICLHVAAISLPITLDLNYKILHNQAKVGFLTSDNPVVLYNQFLEGKTTFGSNVGLAAKGLQMFVPLSPKYLIIFYDPDVYLVGNERDLIIDISKVSAINQLNYLQFLNCNENVYKLCQKTPGF